MKKKNLSVKKAIHKKLLYLLKNRKIIKEYKSFTKNLNNLEDKRYAVSVSGGSDSLALSYFMKCYSLLTNKKVFYFIIDHGLRKDSDEEAKLVRNKLRLFDINCKIIRLKNFNPKSNIQSLSRTNRYNAILKECKKLKISVICTGHHKDDLYENFFIRILRGSGLKGLSTFNNPITQINDKTKLIRPLLNLSKADLIFVSMRVFNFYVNDPSNKNELFKRTKIRKLITQLSDEGLNFDKLKLTINNLYESEKTLDYYVKENKRRNATFLKLKHMYLLNKNFFLEPNEVVFRSLSEVLVFVSGKYYPPRGKKLSNTINTIKEKNFKKTTLSGCVIEKFYNSVIIYRES